MKPFSISPLLKQLPGSPPSFAVSRREPGDGASLAGQLSRREPGDGAGLAGQLSRREPRDGASLAGQLSSLLSEMCSCDL